MPPSLKPPGSGAPGAVQVPPLIDVEQISSSPAWFPVNCPKGDTVRLVRLDEADYRSASFLDQRLFQLNRPRGRCAATELSNAAQHCPPRASYIFHIGHVGSTLISRLLGEAPEWFCLREPALLRQAAAGQLPPQLPLPALLGVLSRTWRAEQRALIKTTSFVSELAEALLADSPDSRALLVFTSARTYLCAIFGGPNSRVESQTLAPARFERLRRRVGAIELRAPACEGESIAMSWLCEASALCQAAERYPTRVGWLDFERFLLDPLPVLSAGCAALGAVPHAPTLSTALAGPLMRQYAKAPEYGYDRELRHEVLAHAEQENAREIQRGLAWLGELAGRHPLIERTLAL